MSLSRRQFLGDFLIISAAAAKIALPSFLQIGCTRRPTKRLGTFEESARAIIEWIRNRKFDAKALGNFGSFKDSLPFELELQIDQALSVMGSWAAQTPTLRLPGVAPLAPKRAHLTKDGYSFDIGVTNGRMDFVFGRIKKSGMIGKFNVYIIDETEDSIGVDGAGGISIKENGVVYVFKDEVEKRVIARSTEDGFFRRFRERFGIGIEGEMRDWVRGVLQKEQVDAMEFAAIVEKFAWDFDVSQDKARLMLFMMRLFYLDQKTAELLEKKVEDTLTTTLIHELTHGSTSTLSLNDEEFLAILTSLAYGKGQYFELVSIITPYLVVSMTGEEVVNIMPHAQALSRLVRYLRKIGFDMEDLMRESVTESGIRNAAREALGYYARDMFGKPFQEAYDVSLFKKAEDFVRELGVS